MLCPERYFILVLGVRTERLVSALSRDIVMRTSMLPRLHHVRAKEDHSAVC
jgi:hypothetical protein